MSKMRKLDECHIIPITQLPKIDRSNNLKKKQKPLPAPHWKNENFLCFVLLSYVFAIFPFFSVNDECLIYNLCNGAVASYQMEAINIEIKHDPIVKPNDV